MAEAIKPYQIKSIYALGNSLGIKGSSHDDELHILIQGITGKESIKQLNFNEAELVLKEMRQRMKLLNAPVKKTSLKKKFNHRPDGPSDAQIKMIWALMGELERWDIVKSDKTIFERLCCIIQKELEVTAFPRQPFQFVKSEDITKLRKVIEGYTTAAYKKYMSSGKGAQHG